MANKYQKLNTLKLTKQLKIAFLLVILMAFSFPQPTVSQDLNAKLTGPIPEESIRSYYEGPSLPEIPLRSARITMYITVTAYNSVPEQTDDTPFITASNTRTRDGVIATNFLPFGTVVRFPDIYGDKEFIVEDRMNSRYYYHMDIWMEEVPDARSFGVQYLKMEIL